MRRWRKRRETLPVVSATSKQLIAHVLRRTMFGPFPGQVEELAPLGVDGVIEILSRPPVSLANPPDTSDDSSDAPVK